MISAALALQDLPASEIMTAFDKVFVLPMDSIIDEKLIEVIKNLGFSRVPVCQSRELKQVFGVFQTKTLVGYTPCGETIE